LKAFVYTKYGGPELPEAFRMFNKASHNGKLVITM
jgi:hypothetical protein